MIIKKIEEELLELFEKIKNKTIIVEGKKDKKILCSFGFIDVNTINKGLYETANKFENKEVIVLTDFDKEGQRIARKLNIFLQSLNCKVDRITRMKLKIIFSKLKIKTIEELKGVGINVKTGANHFKIYNIC